MDEKRTRSRTSTRKKMRTEARIHTLTSEALGKSGNKEEYKNV